VVQPNLELTAGNPRIEVRQELPIWEDQTLWGIGPHMHMLGREMKVWATLPDGKSTDLVWIKDWDFNWQESYAYLEPIKLPKGSRVHLVAYYDNSEGNPRNPNRPPKLVTWGEQTTDEMCIAFLGITRDAEKLAVTPRPYSESVALLDPTQQALQPQRTASAR
jgi:hypothetical protein